MLRSVALAAAAFGLAQAQWDPNAPLEKPPLHENLDYLEQPLEDNLPQTQYTLSKWDNDFIPSGCKDHIDAKYNLADIEIYDVTYEDCGDPWVFCHHKDSTISIDSMAGQFGRLPIQMREWVRHVADLPDDGGHAYETDSSVFFFQPSDNMITVIAHETGHSLDLSGAYADNPLSSSQTWADAYNADSNVPDPYAQSNAVEDVAQNTVVAFYDENVPGKFPALEPGWESIHAQYDTILREARDAGVGNSLLLPGKSEQCNRRVPSSDPVPKSDTAAAAKAKKPDVSLKSGVKAINPVKHTNRSECKLHW